MEEKHKSHQQKTAAQRNRFRYTGGLQKPVRQFLENLSVLVSAGMDVLSAVESVESEFRSRRMKRFVGEIREHIENGGSLWKGMEDTGIFPKQIVALVKIGEDSGKLTDNLATIVKQLEKEWLFKSKIRTAMLYPAIVLPLTFFVGIGVAWFALPRLATMYTQMNVELPYLTRMLIKFGDFLSEYGNIAVPLVLCSFVVVLYFLFSFPKTKAIGQILLAKIPVFRRLIREVELARLGYILGNLLNAGIPIVDAIESLRSTTTFYAYKKFYGHVKEGIQQGNNVEDVFSSYKKSHKLIPKPIQQMIMIGEKSGKLGTTLEKIGHAYEIKIESSIRDISTLIEPVLLIIIGCAVGLIAVATLMPIYNLATII